VRKKEEADLKKAGHKNYKEIAQKNYKVTLIPLGVTEQLLTVLKSHTLWSQNCIYMLQKGLSLYPLAGFVIRA
jgi:hypothetical protein